jgi:hypothetical protein
MSKSEAELDAILDAELNALDCSSKSNEISGGLSQSDKDKYIESLLSEIADLKKQLHTKTSDLNINNLEEMCNISLDDLNESITLKPPDVDDEDEDGDDGEKFDPNNILNMLGAFMNNDMLKGDGGESTPNMQMGENPMMQMLSKMMEGLGENMQSGDFDSKSDEDASDSENTLDVESTLEDEPSAVVDESDEPLHEKLD